MLLLLQIRTFSHTFLHTSAQTCTQLHTHSHTCTCALTLTVSDGTILHTNPSKPIIGLPSSGFITCNEIYLFFFHSGIKRLLLTISEPLYLGRMGPIFVSTTLLHLKKHPTFPLLTLHNHF